MENLSEKELREIGGGGVFENNTNSMGIAMSTSSESLLNITFTRTYGDHYSETTISAGNDIVLNFGVTGNNQ